MPTDDYWPFTRMKELMMRRETRTGTQLTYQDIADATGLSVSTVERYANNRVRRPDLTVVRQLCEYFGVSLRDFVFQEDEPGEVVAVAVS